MHVSDSLRIIYPLWLIRVQQQLTQIEGVQEGFKEELTRFWDLFLKAISAGEPSLIDPILDDWIKASIQTDVEEAGNSVIPLLNKFLLIGYEVASKNLSSENAIDFMGYLLPIFEHSVEYTAGKEMEIRILQVTSQLNQTRERLESLDKSKSDFIAIAAHELKTPLTLIEGYTEMLRQHIEMEGILSEHEQLLCGIDKGAHRLKEIIDDMIDVSLIDNNLLLLNFQPLRIGRMFQQILNEYAPVIEERAIRTRFIEFFGNDNLIFGDEERLLQAFRNLVSNAIKFTPDGGSITIDGRTLSGFVEVTIADTGIGIDPKDQVKIFEKFGQLGKVLQHSSGKTKYKGGGPGLGLAITKGIIEAHRGAIWVESDGYDEDKCPGSVFHILLPMQKEPPDDKSARLFRLLSKNDANYLDNSGL